MELKLIRRYKGPKYTIGSLYIDDEFFCDTLEDVDRGISDKMSEAEVIRYKIYGKTAIPTGRYRVSLDTVSQKFKTRVWALPYGGKLPRLLNVKGFDGVLIHVGNTPEDTLGCILVGRNTVVGKVMESTVTFHKLMNRMKTSHSEIYITIK